MKSTTSLLILLWLAAACHQAMAAPTSLAMTQASDVVRIAISGTPNDSLVLEYASALAGPWSVRATFSLQGNGEYEFVEVNPGAPQRFYRTRGLEGGVYSINMVGYLSLAVPAQGAIFLSNPFLRSNTIAAMMPDVPNGLVVMKVGASGFSANNYLDGWSSSSMTALPGEGFLVRNPNSSPVAFTFFGEVIGSGTATLSAGWTLCGSMLPQSGPLQSQLLYPAADGNTVYLFNPATASYSVHTFDAFEGWVPQEPVLGVGQAFWSSKSAAASWSRSFEGGGASHVVTNFAASSAAAQVNFFTYNTASNLGRIFGADKVTPAGTNVLAQLYAGTNASSVNVKIGVPVAVSRSRTANIVWVSDAPSSGGPFFTNNLDTFTDHGWIALLTNAGHRVLRYNPPDASTTTLPQADIDALNTNDLIILGRALGSGAFLGIPQVADWNIRITKPILSINAYITRHTRMGWFGFPGNTLDGVPTQLTAIDINDPVTAYLFGGVALTNGNMTAEAYDEALDRNTSHVPDPPVTGGRILARAAFTPSLVAAIAEWPAGTAVRGGADILGGYRMYFAGGSRELDLASVPGTSGKENLTATGEDMFLRAVEIAVRGGVATLSNSPDEGAGYVRGTVVNFSNAVAGQTIYLRVRAWNVAAGATYEATVASGGARGESAVFSVVAGGGPNTLPAEANNFASFAVGVPPTCVPPPPGLVSWWMGESNALDLVGGNHGTLQNGATFAPGKVGTAFFLDGTNDWVDIGYSTNFATGSYTIEGWFRKAGATGSTEVIFAAIGGVHELDGLILQIHTDGRLRFRHTPSAPGAIDIFSPITVSDGAWHHVAVVRDSTTNRLYIDGFFSGTAVTQTDIDAQGDLNFMLGGLGHIVTEFGGIGHYSGWLDDIAVYGKALSSIEIVSIYTAGSAGKCPPPPPSIAEQPVALLTSTENDATTLSVTAGGDAPLFYQWLVNGVALAGATNSSLAFANTQFTNRGNYSVVISNAAGSVTSSVATVLVRARPWLYWSTAGELPGGPPNSKIKRAWLNGTNMQVVLASPESGRFGGIAFDAPGQRFYTGDDGRIIRANLNGSARTNLVAVTSPVGDIEINLQDQHLYFSRFNNGSAIYRMPLLTPELMTLYSADASAGVGWEGLAVDPEAAEFYFANSVSGPDTIERSDTAGGGRMPLIHTSDANPFDVEFDPLNDTLYWNQNLSPSVRKATRSAPASIATVITIANGNGNGLHVDTRAQKIYFGSGSTNIGGNISGSIYMNRCNPDGTGLEILFTELGRINYMETIYPSATNLIITLAQGGGTVSISPARHFFDFGEQVTLTAAPSSYYAFSGWSDSDTSNPRTITVGVASNYTAIFNNVVGAPVILVNGESNNVFMVTNAASVEIQSPYPGARIYFTLDGSDPDNGELYSGPFLLEESAVVRAVAYTPDYLGAAEADPVTITVVSGPVILLQPQSVVVAGGDTLVLNAVAGGDLPLSYQWRFNGADIPGANSPSFVQANVQVFHAGAYSVRVSNPYGTTFSADANVVVRRPPMVAPHPASTTVDRGSNVVFCVGVDGDGPFRFQWRKNGVNIPGANNQCYSITNVQVSDGGRYSVVVQNDVGAAISDSALLTVALPPLAGGDAFATRIDIGTNICFAGTNFGATREFGEPRHAGKTGGRSIWYTWQAPFNSIATFETVGSSFDTLLAVYTGSNVANLTLVAADEDGAGFLSSRVQFNALAGVQYQIAVDGYDGSEGTFTICRAVEVALAPLPTITRHPTNDTVRRGEPVTFVVAASNAVGNVGWYYNGVALSNQHGPTLAIANVFPEHVGFYRAAFSNAVGGVAFTDTAVLEIGPVRGVQSVDKLPDLAVDPASFGRIRLLATVSTGVGISVGAGTIQSHVINNTGSGSDPIRPLPCEIAGGASRWLLLLPTNTATMRIDTIGSTIDTVLGILTGPTPGEALPFLCDDDSAPNRRSLIQFTAQRGTPYYVQADGKSGTNGQIHINWALGLAPTNHQPLARHALLQGDNLTLVSGATGTPAPELVWLHDGAGGRAIRASTAAGVLELRNVQPADTGIYWLVASNALGVITNPVAIVTVQTNDFAAAEASFDLDAGLWMTRPGVSNLQHRTSGGNPGGFLVVTGATQGWRIAAPEEYLGNKFHAHGGVLSFDLLTSMPNLSGAYVQLEGEERTLRLDLAVMRGPGTFSFKALLNETNWWTSSLVTKTNVKASTNVVSEIGKLATRGQLLGVLSALQAIEIAGGALPAGAFVGVDNVALLMPNVPLLSLRNEAGQWLIEWPVALGESSVETSTDLMNWGPPAPPSETNNRLQGLRVGAESGQRFFRLKR